MTVSMFVISLLLRVSVFVNHVDIVHKEEAVQQELPIMEFYIREKLQHHYSFLLHSELIKLCLFQRQKILTF